MLEADQAHHRYDVSTDSIRTVHLGGQQLEPAIVTGYTDDMAEFMAVHCRNLEKIAMQLPGRSNGNFDHIEDIIHNRLQVKAAFSEMLRYMRSIPKWQAFLKRYANPRVSFHLWKEIWPIIAHSGDDPTKVAREVANSLFGKKWVSKHILPRRNNDGSLSNLSFDRSKRPDWPKKDEMLLRNVLSTFLPKLNDCEFHWDKIVRESVNQHGRDHKARGEKKRYEEKLLMKLREND
ncbi:uncharacterized protein LOC141854632 [Brevipalpus obovatus]|uniref:uncharacterized protein LOC141854632 n=1 Tax=Brevipalpus obovatus TaxID=246614 RepID=UPI003D9F6E53